MSTTSAITPKVRETRSLAFYIATFVAYILAVYPVIGIAFRLERLIA